MATVEKRINKNNTESYRAKVRIKGYPTQTATFDRKTDAKKWASDVEADLRAGRYFKTAASKKYTLGSLIDKYIETVLVRKPKAIAAQKPQLLWWKEELGNHLLSDITPALISEKRDKLAVRTTFRKSVSSTATVNRYLAALSHAMTIAVKEWEWINDSPLTKVSKLKESRGRVRFLNEDERESLLKTCKESSSEFLYIIVVLALSTGARKMEMLNLRWQDIDFELNRIIIHETKNGERRVLALKSFALKLMHTHYQSKLNESELVFPSKIKNQPVDIRKPWETAIKNSGVKDFKFHDLRHTAASYMAMNGATLAEIAAALGHKTLQMVKRYAHISDCHTASVIERMNDKIFGENNL